MLKGGPFGARCTLGPRDEPEAASGLSVHVLRFSIGLKPQDLGLSVRLG